MTDPGLYFPARRFLRATLLPLHRVEALGLDNIPATGGALLASNHASHLDVPVIGLIPTRHIAFVIRDTLIGVPLFGYLFRNVGTVVIKRGAPDTAALRAIVERMRAGDLVAIFPEGTRTRDGELGALRAGVVFAARRAGVPVIPVGLAGTYEGYPRTRRFPKLRGKIVVSYGPPIRFGARGSDDLETVRSAIQAEMRRARERRLAVTKPNTPSLAVSPSHDGA